MAVGGTGGRLGGSERGRRSLESRRESGGVESIAGGKVGGRCVAGELPRRRSMCTLLARCLHAACTLLARCMCAACALHVHRMCAACAACALRVHCQASPSSWALAKRPADWSDVDHTYEEELAYAAAMQGAAGSASAEGTAAEVPPRRSQAVTEEVDAAGAAPRGGLLLCYGEVWEGGLAPLLEGNEGGSEGGGGLCVRLSQGPSPSDCLATLLLGGRRVAEVALPSRAGAWLPLQLVVEPAGARLLYRRREVFAEPVCICMSCSCSRFMFMFMYTSTPHHMRAASKSCICSF